MRYSRNQQETDDIMQEGVLQIYKDLYQFDSKRASFKTWSQRVIVHAALKYIKKNNWQNLFQDINEYKNEMAYNDLVESNIAKNEILDCLQKLPAGYKLVFNLYVMEEYNHKEIAEKLNISEGTSKSQLFKARKMLRELIENTYINE